MFTQMALAMAWLLPALAFAQHQTLIIDHTCTDVKNVPAAYIEKAHPRHCTTRQRRALQTLEWRAQRQSFLVDDGASVGAER